MTNVNVIKANAHKYSVSAMCKVLNIPRSSYYYEAKKPQAEDNPAAEIREIFRQSRNNYGTRKIKVELARKGYTVSRRRIGRIMKQEGLVSSCAVEQYRPHVDKCNESQVQNIVNREFSDQPQYNMIVSDLTYVRAGNSWNYICVLVDLFNREIIGYSAGKNKDAALINKAFTRVDVNLNKISIDWEQVYSLIMTFMPELNLHERYKIENMG